MIQNVLVYKKVENDFIKCIKTIRGATGEGLKEAKVLVELMRDTDSPIEITLSHRYGVDFGVTYLKENGFTVSGFVHECFQENEDLFEI